MLNAGGVANVSEGLRKYRLTDDVHGLIAAADVVRCGCQGRCQRLMCRGPSLGPVPRCFRTWSGKTMYNPSNIWYKIEK